MVEEVSLALGALRNRARLLDEVAWSPAVEQAFFAAGATQLPRVDYAVDQDRLQAEDGAIQCAMGRLHVDRGHDDVVGDWLYATLDGQRQRVALLQSVGGRSFGRLSAEIYGTARSRFPGLALSNEDLANHLLARLDGHGMDAARDTPHVLADATACTERLRARIDAEQLPLAVVMDDGLTAKALAGGRRVRVRADARFAPWEEEGLYRHEVETHALGLINAAASPLAPLLRAGGPRATATQEGLAVFAELYHRALAVPRLRRLALRVRLVAMAEDGASFLDGYRHLLDEGYAPREAYLDVARVFRGSDPAGGSAFTKDSCYLAGLVRVHGFLSAMVRAGHRDACELLACGRFALEDMPALMQLRSLGLLRRPERLPTWLRDWDLLLPYFAFASFLDGIDLRPLARQHDAALAAAATIRLSQQ